MTFHFWARHQRARVAPPPPPVGSFSASIANGAFTVQQGGSTSRVITIVRTSYTETITPTVAGLPDGVTASFSPTTSTGSHTSLTVTLTATSGAGLVTADAFTVTLTGSGVDPVVVNGTVTVVEPVPVGAFAPNLPAGYTLIADTTFDNTFGATGGMSAEDVSYGGFVFRCYHGSDVVADAAAPSGTGYALAARSQIGDSAHYTLQVSCPTWPANRRGLFAVYSFRLNDGYRSHPSSDKTLYPSVRYNDGPTLQTPMCLIQRTTDSNHRFRVEQMPRWVSGSFNSLMFNNMNGYSFPSNDYLFSPGTYLRVQYECYLETPGLPDAASDGIFRSWVSVWNGTAWSTPILLFEATNVSYSGGLAETSLYWVNAAFVWQFYRGGNEGADLATANEVTYIDRCAFYTAP